MDPLHGSKQFLAFFCNYVGVRVVVFLFFAISNVLYRASQLLSFFIFLITKRLSISVFQKTSLILKQPKHTTVSLAFLSTDLTLNSYISFLTSIGMCKKIHHTALNVTKLHVLLINISPIWWWSSY